MPAKLKIWYIESKAFLKQFTFFETDKKFIE